MTLNEMANSPSEPYRSNKSQIGKLCEVCRCRHRWATFRGSSKLDDAIPGNISGHRQVDVSQGSLVPFSYYSAHPLST